MMINTEVIIIEIIFNLMILIIKTRITISSRTGEFIHNIIINNRENKLIIKILKFKKMKKLISLIEMDQINSNI